MKRYIQILLLVCLCFGNQAFSQLPKEKKSLSRIKERIFGFLDWYGNNQERLNNLSNVSIVKINPKDSSNHIDFEGLTKYLLEFSKNGYTSKKFEENLINHYKSIEDSLVTNLMREGNIPYLSYDQILQTFDDRDILDNVFSGNITNLKRSNNTYILKLDYKNFNPFLVVVSKINGDWYIDSMSVLVDGYKL